MSFDIEDEIVIDRPPEDVWRWTVEDPEREQQWRNLDGTGVQELQRLDDGPVTVGSRFWGTVKVGPGNPQAYTNEVTELEEHRRISWETIEAEGALGGRGTYELTPLDDGRRTRFVIRLDYPPRTFLGRLQRPIVRLAGRPMIAKMIAKLKRLVESDTAAG
ncbi:MAG: SRPBCC family protein [Nitriliruptorales bacterium]|nr:SRPBCC family protein [Nitriliruptorales bacterium]